MIEIRERVGNYMVDDGISTKRLVVLVVGAFFFLLLSRNPQKEEKRKKEREIKHIRKQFHNNL